MHDTSSAARWTRAALCSAVLVLSLHGAGLAALPTTSGVQAGAVRNKALAPKHFPIRSTGIRPNLGSGQMYTIVSVGAPSAKTYRRCCPTPSGLQPRPCPPDAC